MDTLHINNSIGNKVLYFEELASTNDKSFELIKSEAAASGTIVHTDYQTKGRGQIGKYWESEKGANLLLSVILRNNGLEAENQFLISIFTSLAIKDLVQYSLNMNATIKWPNDIYVANDKICGILIQNSIMNKNISASVIGIGLNVNQTKFSPTIPNPCSCKSIAGKEFPLEEMLEKLTLLLKKYYNFLLKGQYNELMDQYHMALYRKDMESSFIKSDGQAIKGNIQGIDPTGKLQLKVGDQMVSFGFHELKYII